MEIQLQDEMSERLLEHLIRAASVPILPSTCCLFLFRDISSMSTSESMDEWQRNEDKLEMVPHTTPTIFAYVSIA